jgi:chaperonin GroEL
MRELDREALKELKVLKAGLDPHELQCGMDLEVDIVLKLLKSFQSSSKRVMIQTKGAQVATIAANGNANIGSLLADAFKAVGKDSVITVQNNKTFEHTLEFTSEMKMESDFLSTFVAINLKTQRVEDDNSLILLTNTKSITFSQLELQQLLEAVVSTNRSLLIFTNQVETALLAGLIINKPKEVLKVVTIRVSSFGKKKLKSLQDIAVAISLTIVSEAMKMKIESAAQR